MPRGSEYSWLRWPSGGVIRRMSFQSQPPFTTPGALNVRSDDALLQRERGGSRPGMSKLNTATAAATITLITDLEYINATPALTMGRYLAAGAFLYSIDANGTSLTRVGNSGSHVSLVSTGNLMATDFNQCLFIVGETAGVLVMYNPTGSTINGVVANGMATPTTTVTGGTDTLPTNCTIVSRFKDRLVLCGDTMNPNQWYMSAVGDPFNWDYSQPTVGAAVSGGNADAGEVGESIRAFCPHSNLCAIFGADSSLWMLRGDPNAGGTISPLSTDIGILDRFSWCYDPEGRLYFVSRDGLYIVPPGCSYAATPIPVSREKIPQELLNIDRTLYNVQLAYDYKHWGVHIWVTPWVTSGSPAHVHWWYSPRDEAFWQVSVSNNNEPLFVYALRNYVNAAEKSTVVLGCRDNHLRVFDRSAETDDGTNFSSYCDFGPIRLGPAGINGILNEIVVTTGQESNEVSVDVRVGDTGELADETNVFGSYDMPLSGVNYTARPRARGSAAVLRVNGTPGGDWELEELLVKVIPAGKRRRPHA